MTDDRMGGIALIAGAVGGIVTMSLHPTGHDLMAPGQFETVASTVAFVHALAIVSLPVQFLGALALSKRLEAPNRLALAALVVYGFALAAVMSAAAASGFVAPRLAREMLASPTPEAWHIASDYNFFLNQAFAMLYAVASSTAIVLWSAAIVRGRQLAKGVGIYGLLLGPLTILVVGSGHLRLGVHGFGMVVLTQAVWFIVVGVLLWRRKENVPDLTSEHES